jgi:hypothetical protein
MKLLGKLDRPRVARFATVAAAGGRNAGREHEHEREYEVQTTRFMPASDR